MYRFIVGRKVRSTFAQLSTGEPDALIGQLANSFEYSFRGDHALGGTRTSRNAMSGWFDRVYRLFPGLTFNVRDVVVKGPPWDTVALTHVEVIAEGYKNELFQKVRLRWGRLTEIVTLENLDVLHEYLDNAHAHGTTEAKAPPLIS